MEQDSRGKTGFLYSDKRLDHLPEKIGLVHISICHLQSPGVKLIVDRYSCTHIMFLYRN